MRRTITNIISIIMICLCGCFLVGCPSPNDESKEAEEYVKQAIPIAEEALKSVHPNATLQKASLQGISGNMVGPDHGLTDWVKGVYRDSSDEDILINVITQEIYTTSEVKKNKHLRYGSGIRTIQNGFHEYGGKCRIQL